MPKPIVFLTHTDADRAVYYPAPALAALQALAEVRLNGSPVPLHGEALIKAAAGAQIIVSDRQTPGEAGLFAASPQLVAFVRGAVDIRTVDVPAASARGVLVTRASPGFTAAVTELILGFMVDLGRGVSRSVLSYRAGTAPAGSMGTQIAGSTVGIIGYGAIGRRLAGVLAAMEAQLLICDPYANVDLPGAEQVDLTDLLARSDFVVCLAVANAETENLMDAAAIAAMRPGAYFVNASRGNLVDETALAAALDNGHLAGAAMDVGRAADQKPSEFLSRRADVIATPHIGGATPAAVLHQAMETTRQVAEILQGRAPEGAVNTEAALRLRRLAPPLAPEVGGTEGPEPTRYGDWQHKGRVTDF